MTLSHQEHWCIRLESGPSRRLSFCITNHFHRCMSKHLPLRVKPCLLHHTQQCCVTTRRHPDLDLHSSAALVWKPLTCLWMPSFSHTHSHQCLRLFPIQVNNFLILINSEVDPWNGFTGLGIWLKIQPHICLWGMTAFRLEGPNAPNVFLQ